MLPLRWVRGEILYTCKADYAGRIRFLALARNDNSPFAPHHLHLDVAALLLRCTQLAEEITAGDYTRNPWQPEHAPQIELMA